MSDTNESGEALRFRSADPSPVRPVEAVDEAMIERLVHAFYTKVRADTELAPIFAARIADWTPHLARMCAFWSSVMLRSGRYEGRPMQKHAPLPIGGVHFDRWLMLFAATAAEVCPPAVAAEFLARARMIAASLEFGIATHRGHDVRDGKRLPAPGSNAGVT